MRKKLVAGNWKMNLTPSEARTFAAALAPKMAGGAEVVFCVPFVSIAGVIEAVKGTDVSVGAQNMYFEDSGAFTGEISAQMLISAGAKHVILGHSERRQLFGESDEIVNRKLVKALEQSLTPIVCVGESLKEREDGVTIELVRMQIKRAFLGIDAESAAKTVVAYEPVWAIGTGVTATTEQAEEVCAAIRALLCELFGSETSQQIRVLYGGSVTAANAQELFAQANIDGGLVGGASLKEDFEVIAKA